MKLSTSCTSQWTHFQIQLILLQNLANFKWQIFNYIWYTIQLNVESIFTGTVLFEICQKYRIFSKCFPQKGEKKKKRDKEEEDKYYSLLNIQLKDFYFFSLCPAEYPGTHIAFIRVRNGQSRFLFLIHCEFMESCLKWITQSYVNIIKFERKNARKKKSYYVLKSNHKSIVQTHYTWYLCIYTHHRFDCLSSIHEYRKHDSCMLSQGKKT